MPTPIGHALAGALIYQGTAVKTNRPLLIIFLLLFFALLPDIDFLFGFPVGDPNRYHHLFTHSLIFVTIAGLVGGWAFSHFLQKSILYSSAIFIAAGISHLLLDCLALDQRPPFGCPLLWPFSNHFFISPMVLFSDVSRISDSKQFFVSLLNLHNLQTIAIETGVLAPLWAIVWFFKRKKRAA
jgi:membrane-bound metal-dependent hydrolase YbcI (DUF457 family)